jgi:hypothetical protein
MADRTSQRFDKGLTCRPLFSGLVLFNVERQGQCDGRPFAKRVRQRAPAELPRTTTLVKFESTSNAGHRRHK